MIARRTEPEDANASYTAWPWAPPRAPAMTLQPQEHSLQVFSGGGENVHFSCRASFSSPLQVLTAPITTRLRQGSHK